MQPKRDDDFFWEGIDSGKLLAQVCADCGTMRHPPAPMCAHCQSVKWVSRELSGRGKIYSWLVSKHPTEPDAAPRTVVLVDLEEGTRLIANMMPGETAAIGDAVTITFGEINGLTLRLGGQEPKKLMLANYRRRLCAAGAEPGRPDPGKVKERPAIVQSEPRRGFARLSVLVLAK
jgi:uncharacterized protein